MLAPLANSTFSNSVIQICPLVLDENQRSILSRRRFETDAAFWHPCGIWKRVFPGFSSFSRTVPPKTLALLEQETLDFTPPTLWPLNSPTSTRWTTACGVCFWGESYRTKISDVDELKRRIKNEWADLNHAVIECAVGEWWVGAIPVIYCANGIGTIVKKNLFRDICQGNKTHHFPVICFCVILCVKRRSRSLK